MLKTIIIIIIVGLLLIAGIYFFLQKEAQQEETETSPQESVGGKVKNSIGNIPSANPYKSITNPFEGVYNNPFE